MKSLLRLCYDVCIVAIIGANILLEKAQELFYVAIDPFMPESDEEFKNALSENQRFEKCTKEMAKYDVWKIECPHCGSRNLSCIDKDFTTFKIHCACGERDCEEYFEIDFNKDTPKE